MGELSIWHWLVILVPIILPLVLKFAFGVGAKKVPMKNNSTGQLKIGFYGFSWTYLFFGWFVPLFRSEIGIAALHLLFSLVTFGLWQIIVSFLYNKQYTQRLIEKGFRLTDAGPAALEAASRLNVDLVTHLRA